MDIKVNDIVKVKKASKVMYVKVDYVFDNKLQGRQVYKDDIKEYVLTKWQRYVEVEFGYNDIVREGLGEVNISKIKDIKPYDEKGEALKKDILNYWKLVGR